jgi:ATP-binding cassette subfamily B (MDR/TAP) protein 1
VFATSEVSHLFSHVPDASKAKGAGASILEWIDYRPSIESWSLPDLSSLTNVTDKSVTRPISGYIKFENVSFTYPSRPSIQVLDGLNLDIPAGSFVALVGHSGCGKSTTIQLLERFYDPTHGRVTVDGRHVKEWQVQELRNEMALVSQEPTLYAGTVAFNIRLGARAGEEVSQDEVERACREANIVSILLSILDALQRRARMG